MENNELKAYIVTVEFDYVAVAANPEEAKMFVDDALRDTCGMREYCEVRPLTHIPPDWDDPKTLVYHNGEGDITIKQACDMSPEYQSALKRFQKAMQPKISNDGSFFYQ